MWSQRAIWAAGFLFSAMQVSIAAGPNMPVLVGLMGNCLGTAAVASVPPLFSFMGKKFKYNDQPGSALYQLQQAQKSFVWNFVQGFVCPVAYYLFNRGRVGGAFGSVVTSTVLGALLLTLKDAERDKKEELGLVAGTESLCLSSLFIGLCNLD